MKIKNKKILNLIIIIIALITIALPVITYAATAAGSTTTKSLMDIVRDMASQWYFIFRYFSIALMLVVLIYLGIKLAISSIAEEKAKYKRMLVDWVVGFIIIFTIHYYMIVILNLNDKCVELVEKVSNSMAANFVTGEELALGLKPSTQGLYEMVRTRAYELRFSIGTAGMIMYMVLVYYTIKFVFIYFKRFFTLLILTILAPLMGLFYAFNKIMTGKAATFKKWASEYAFNVFLQTIHAIAYGIFVTLAIGLSSQSIAGFVLAMVMLNFMGNAEKIMRKIFKLSGGLVDDNANKGIRENLAAVTAMKASMGAVFGSQMAKDIGSGMKNIVGGIASSGIRGGMVAYDKGVDKAAEITNKLKEKEEKKLEEEKLDKTKSNKEKLKREADIENKIAMLDNLTKKFGKAQTEKNRRLEGYRGGIKDPEKLQEYIDEKTKGIRDPELKRQQQERLREENKNKILKRVKTKNKMTGQTEITGVGTKIKGEINRVIWGNNEIKSATKDIIKTTATGIAGMFMTIASVPMIVTEPVAGLALLAKGRQKSKQLFSNNDFRRVTNLGERRAIRAGQRVIRERQKEEIKKLKKESKITKKERKILKKPVKQEKGRRLSFNRFNPRSLETIKVQMQIEGHLNMARRLNSLSLGNLLLTSPFRLTGTLGAVRTLQSKAYKLDEARKDYYENIETFTTLEKKDSISKDFIADYNLKINGIKNKIASKSDSEILEKFDEDTGKVVTVGGTKLRFGSNIKPPSTPAEIKSQIIDNVLLKVAARNKILDIKDLNLKSNKIQTQLAEEFRKIGVLKETIIPEEFEIDKTLRLNIDKLEDRINIISKDNPKAVEETIAKEVIVDYMERNNIEDANIIKQESHREKIKQEILQVLEEAEEDKPFELVQANPIQTSEVSDRVISSVDNIIEESESKLDTRTTEVETPGIILDEPTIIKKPEMTIDAKITEVETLIDKIGNKTEGQSVENNSEVETLDERKDIDTIFTVPESSDRTEDVVRDVDDIVSEALEAEKVSYAQFVKEEESDYSRRREPIGETQYATAEAITFEESRLENVVRTQERRAKKEERLELFENLIVSLEKSEPTIEETMIENEVIAEERKRQVEVEKGELDTQLEGFEKIINEDLDDTKAIEDYIENETSPEVDQLLAQLLALKEQDMVGVALRFKPNSYERKRMQAIDSDRVNSTYKKKI